MSQYGQFFAHYLRAKAREKPLIHALAAFMYEHSVKEDFTLPTDEETLSDAAHQAFILWDALTSDEQHRFIKQFIPLQQRMMPEAELAAPPMAKIRWLGQPALRNKDAALGALLELRESGHEVASAKMINDLLAKVGRTLSNTHSFLRSIADTSDLVEILEDANERKGLTFKLKNEKAVKAAQDLRDKHTRKTAGEGSKT